MTTAIAPAQPCAVCHDGEASPGEWPVDDGHVCSWACEARARADSATCAIDAMQAIVDLIDATPDQTVFVNVSMKGGHRHYHGMVVDWVRDGTVLIIEAEIRDTGRFRELTVRHDDCRRIEVVDG